MCGEAFAARHLTELGMVVLERNWRCPAGEIDLSTTTGPAESYLTDFGLTTTTATTTHSLTLYRASSGALVFGAGTVQWGWGLDQDHDGDDSSHLLFVNRSSFLVAMSKR